MQHDRFDIQNQNRTRLGRAIRMALITGLCIGVSAVYAQGSDNAEEDENSDAEGSSLDRMTVTARRRDEAQLDVPFR